MEVLMRIMTYALHQIKEWGAGVSLIISIVSLVKSSKAQRLQNRVNELEFQIKQNEVERIAREKEEANRACVEARVVKLGEGQHRLKVWNSGNAVAYNVTARFVGDVGMMIIDREKQPFEELEANKSYDLCLVVPDGAASKFRIITEWTDMYGEKKQKIQIRDCP